MPVTASARERPPLICVNINGSVANEALTSPAISAAAEGLPPLYGTCRMEMPAALPCAPCYLPDPALSESVKKLVLHHLERPFATPVGWFARAGRLLKQAGGDRRLWRAR